MTKKRTIRLFVFFTILVFSIASASGVQAKKVLWKLQAAWPTTLPCSGDLVPWITNNIKTASEGEINIKYYDPGKLVGAFEILDAVSKGKIDAGVAVSGFWQGKIPAAAIFSSVPFGPEAPEFMAWLFNGNGMKLYQEMYDQAGYNVKVLPAIILAPETSGWFSKPINSPDDLKGLKMRFFGLGGKAMQKLGVSVSLIPPAEVFAALEKGAIDAAEQSMPIIDRKLGFYKIIKYNYFPGWHQQATIMEMLINKDKWNMLTKGQQKLIEMVTQACLTYSIAYGEGSQGAIIKENAEKYNVNNMYWSDEMLDTFQKAWAEVVAEEIAKDEFFKKVWEDLQAFRAEYKFWNSLAFLPRNKPE